MNHVKSIRKLQREYIVQTNKHQIKMKRGKSLYSAKSEKELTSYLMEKGLI